MEKIPKTERIHIMACEGSFKDFGIEDPYPKIGKPYELNFGLKNPKNINWESSEKEIKENNFLSGGKETWVFSEVDESDKFSKIARWCTVLTVVGKEKNTGKNISFMSHQDPFKFLHAGKNQFIAHLRQRLNEISERCEEKTFSATITGGRFYTDEELDKYQVEQTYLNSLDLLGSEVRAVIGLEPTAINGPKLTKEITKKQGDDVYFDTKNRRLYFLRPELNQPNGKGSVDFPPSEIEPQKKNWE